VDFFGGINGVFKGGGAKGVVYAGALRAVEERGIEFKAVAGSSAGAITAALIAARMPAETLAEATSEGLQSVRPRILGGFLPWVGKSLFSVDRLEEWLEEQLRVPVAAHAGTEPTEPVTFRQLYDATNIELNVVAMDLARKQPVVFSDQTAPDCSVARAVVASCAIPVAMPAGRVLMKGEDDLERVHRIVDGGAWANFPAFVFRDPSFREFHSLRALPPGRPTVGFVINDPGSGDLPRPERPIRMEGRSRRSDDLGSGRAAGMLGALLNWGMFRLSALIVVPLVLGLVLLAWLRDQLERFFPFVQTLPNTMEAFTVVVLLLLFVILIVAAVPLAVGVFRLGREVFDVGLPSAFAALSVGPGVPDWVGRAKADPVVRLSTPKGITTTKFKISDDVRRQAINYAYIEAGLQLADLMAGKEPTRLLPLEVPEQERVATRGSRWRLGAGIMLALVFGPSFALGLARNILSGRVLQAIGTGLALAAVTIVLIVWAARVRALRATDIPLRRGWGRLWTLFAVFAALFSFVTALVTQVDVGSVSRFGQAEHIPATVTRVEGDEPRTYEVRLDSPLGGIRGGTVSDLCGRPQPTTCLEFRSPQTTMGLLQFLAPRPTFGVGDQTEVLYVPGTGEAFLAGEEWDNDDLTTAAVNIGFWLALALAVIWATEDLVRNWRARRRDAPV
jgi:predicted acylesterase/phospholipase RssA